MFDYIRNAKEVYKKSFSVIRTESQLSQFPKDISQVLVRLIHTCGQTDMTRYIAYTNNIVIKAHSALLSGAPVLCDSSMVAAGITRTRLPANNKVITLVSDPRVFKLASRLRFTRSAAAIDLWADYLENAVLAIGNAPTALFRLLEILDNGAPTPAALLGGPVGFIGSVKSKEELIKRTHGMSYLIITGRRGGSAIAAAAVNAIASLKE